MSRKTQKDTGKTTTLKELVTVAFAEDLDLAKEYKEMLATHDIPAAIKRQPEMAQNGFSDIAIMVPEDLLDEAHALISEQASYDDFFDVAFGDPDSRDYEENTAEIPYDDSFDEY